MDQKAANGVVLITTKHGKAGKINITAKAETTYNMRTITPEFENGVNYANFLNGMHVLLVTMNPFTSLKSWILSVLG